MSSRDRNAAPIIDAVRRQRAEDIREGRDPYDTAPRRAYPWHQTATPEQRNEAERILATADPLTLETDR